MDSNIDLMKVKIGELDINMATEDYLYQKEAVLRQFTEMNNKCELLITYS